MPDPLLVIASSFPDSGVPKADAEDSMAGAIKIPFEVTEARRKGEVVKFVQDGRRERWYWMMLDGRKIYHN